MGVGVKSLTLVISQVNLKFEMQFSLFRKIIYISSNGKYMAYLVLQNGTKIPFKLLLIFKEVKGISICDP